MSGVLAAARVRITPEESRAIGRFLAAAVRVLARMGYGWAALAAAGALLIGTAAWTAPTWWGWVRDWWDH